MQTIKGRSPRHIFLLEIFLLAFATTTFAQDLPPTKPAAPEDVVRINTDLVQTDVTVTDKHGHFVKGLTPEQFELRVDAKPQSLAFFEEIITGSRDEEKQLTAMRGGNAVAVSTERNTDAQSSRGQLIFFFVDDVHLGGEGLSRTRSLLLDFLENKMKDHDRVAIVSTSGQIGFLQQLTGNKAVLREAISRLNVRFNPEATASRVVISEVDANMVENHADRGLFSYLVVETMREYRMQSPINAVLMVKNRVRQINNQAKEAELTTLYRLENLIRSTGPLPGRKLVFLISDGFVVDIKRSNGAEVVRRIGLQAAQVGVAIYSLDTRATFFGPGADVTRNEFPDMSGGTAWRSIAESKAPQEPLETLADETGGRSYLNANALSDGISQALAENSGYYLLVWRPDTTRERAGESRIAVTIRDRPDLRVRARRHFFDIKTDQPAKLKAAATNSPEEELRMALGSLYPRRDLPTSVTANVTNTASGATLSVSMELDAEMLSFDAVAGRQQSIVDVLGVALDDRGQFSSFRQRLDIPKAATANGGRFVKWNQSLQLPPGLYQVRVAVRDRQSARTGSAMLWIEIPRTEQLRKHH